MPVPFARMLVCTLLLLVSFGTNAAASKEYRLILTDGSDFLCAIVANDPEGRRLQIQESDQPELTWISYHKIKAIVEESSQMDVTGQYISSLPLSTVPTDGNRIPDNDNEPATVDTGMGSGTVIALSILGTIALLVLLGALAN
jgi:hypothetical protein